MRDDPDETEGRALYRAQAEALASAHVNYGRRKVRRLKKKSDADESLHGRLVPHHESGPAGVVFEPDEWHADAPSAGEKK